MINVKEIAASDLNKKISVEEYEERLQKVRTKMQEKEIDIGFVYGTHCLPGDIQYLCGYDTQIENVGGVISPSKFFILAGPEGKGYGDEMMQTGEWKNTTLFKIPLEEYPGVEWIELKDIIKEASNKKIKRVAFLTSPDLLSVSFYNEVRNSIPDDVEILDMSDIMAELRYIKSTKELELIGIANYACTEAMKIMLDNVKPGVRETEIAAIGDYVVKKMGCYSGGSELDNVVMSGPRLDTVFGRATNKKLIKGEMISLSVVGRFEGYSSTVARTLVVGGANKEQSDYLEVGIKAFEIASERLVYNKPSKDLEISVREFLKSQGYVNLYSCAHGTGISECLEGFPATTQTEYAFPKNIAMMIDIGIFGSSKDGFGQRHEDEFMINENGETIRYTNLPVRVYS